MEQLPVLMTTQEVAEHLRIHPATVRRWVSEGKLKAVDMPGRAHRYRREDIKALIAAEQASA
jgi:excisionase family DNA binding protein